MSMLTVWILWEITSVTVLQDTLEMEHTALVRKDLVKQNLYVYQTLLRKYYPYSIENVWARVQVI